jgi:4-diphosphocytidyl-2-C-methyl-D-erythritol kinase
MGDGDHPVVREARAKLNVFLRVLGRREDGYHDLESLVLPMSLTDTVTVTAADALRVNVRGPSALTDAVKAGGMNLALVAALALGDACGAKGALVEIDKRIPVAAGLGGGSADAAATMLALNELWDCGLDLESLIDVGARVGSDVPALLVGGAVLVTGRGDRLESANVAPAWWVVVPLDFPTRSPEAYRWWDEDGGPTGPPAGELLAAARHGDIGALGGMLFNDLEAPVIARHPRLGEAKRRLMSAGALGAVMSGSGPTVVGLARSELHASELVTATPGAIDAFGPSASSSGPVGSASVPAGRG